jgi:hypothetical protein
MQTAPMDVDALARAITASIGTSVRTPDSTPVLLDAFKKMEDRIAELAASRGTYGGGGVVRIADDQEVHLSNDPIGSVNVNNFPATQPVSSTTLSTEATLARLANFLSPTDPVSVSGIAAAGAALSVSIPAVAGKTNHIQRFTLTSGSTAVNPVTADVTMTGPTSNHSYRFVQPTTVGGRLDPFWIPALPASGPNVAITVSVPAITGGAVLALNLTGFRI